jgi:tetratricopeptide (TPR) repeat protein
MKIRQDGLKEGQAVPEIAEAIHLHCAVSLLRARRLATGLNLKDAADALKRLAVDRLGAPRVDKDQLGHWETDRQPRPATVRLLCDLFGCTVRELGLERPATSSPSSTILMTTNRSSPQDPDHTAEDSIGRRVESARRSLDQTLAAGTVTTTQLDFLDEQILWSRERYIFAAPEPMLKELLDQLSEVEHLSKFRQPATVQVHLSELAAVLATLIADALMKLGRVANSQSWYATARSAADGSGNTELRARVRAQAAMLPFYYGPLQAAVTLAREARILTRNKPSLTGAFASAAEARALAKLGDEKGAEAALRHAAAAFERSNYSALDADAFGFPERRLLLYRSGTLTALGRTRQARQAQEEALALYQAGDGIDPTLLSLEAAICLALERSASEACQLAGATVLRISAAHRTPIVEERAREVINVLPPAARSGRAVRELHDILALPPGQM